jgi:hypothetical protein
VGEGDLEPPLSARERGRGEGSHADKIKTDRGVVSVICRRLSAFICG